MTQKSVLPEPYSHHADAAAIGTNPSRAIADPPAIFFKTFITDLETAGTVPTERQFLAAAVTLELFFAPSPLRI